MTRPAPPWDNGGVSLEGAFRVAPPACKPRRGLSTSTPVVVECPVMDYRLTTLAVRLRAAGHSCERVGRLLGLPAGAVRAAVLARLDGLRREVAAESRLKEGRLCRP